VRRLALAPALVLLAACGGEEASPPAVDLRVAVTADEGDVTPGKAFPLTVVRSWNKDLVPAAFDERALAPLVVRSEGTSRRESRTHVEETRRYRAYAFALADVRVPPLAFAARPMGGGAEKAAVGDGLVLRVRPDVDRAEPGPPELPGDPPAPPTSRWPWVAGAAAAILAAAAFVAARARRRPVAPPSGDVVPAARGPSAADRALARLEEIRARAPGGEARARADVAEACDVVRAFLVEDFHISAFELTSEEILGELPPDRLAPVLSACDAVKFAAASPNESDRMRLLDDAAAFVRESERRVIA
jgi:hypothetical protein